MAKRNLFNDLSDGPAAHEQHSGDFPLEWKGKEFQVDWDDDPNFPGDRYYHLKRNDKELITVVRHQHSEGEGTDCHCCGEEEASGEYLYEADEGNQWSHITEAELKEVLKEACKRKK